MAHSDPNTITLIELEDDRIREVVLKIDDSRRAVLTQSKINGKMAINFMMAGPIQLQEAQSFIEGLLELSFKAEQLNLEFQHGKKKK